MLIKFFNDSNFLANKFSNLKKLKNLRFGIKEISNIDIFSQKFVKFLMKCESIEIEFVNQHNYLDMLDIISIFYRKLIFDLLNNKSSKIKYLKFNFLPITRFNLFLIEKEFQNNMCVKKWQIPLYRCSFWINSSILEMRG